MSNSLTTLSTLQNEITDLQRKLSPAGDEVVAKALASLRTAGLRAPEGIPATDINKVYSFALSGLSGYALNKVVRRIIQGEFPHITAFIPTPPELAHLTRNEQVRISEDLIRAKAKAEAMAPPERHTLSPEAKARMKALWDQFKWNHKAEKAKERGTLSPDLPLTPEREDELRRMLALKDAQNITAEQLAFRRHIEMKLAPIEAQEAAE